jgi:hypothetical protein
VLTLDFLPAAAQFFSSRAPDDEVASDILVLCQEIAKTTPPTAYPGIDRLKQPSLRGIFYFRYYKKKSSIRLYFMAEKDILELILVNDNKRRTELTSGEIKQLEHALKEAKAQIANKTSRASPKKR